MKLGWKRLLKLADILDVADAEHRAKGEPTYFQAPVVHPCGAPACAIGHYAAAAASKQRGWGLSQFGVLRYGEPIGIFGSEVRAEFDINLTDALNLFDANGCGGARTAKQAAKYIRKLVKSKERDLTP